ncbi:hypothetical protein C8R44DRAFT_873754 [Mycena epipterygia]|nr:hypothetical protein C8R44DRAFT_873754 [Mycena epipterygia]
MAALEIPRRMFTSYGYLCGHPICDKVLVDIFFATGRTLEAVKMYENVLGEISLLHDMRSAAYWTVVKLVHGKSTGSAYVVSWALRLVADIFRGDGDDQLRVRSSRLRRRISPA